MDKLLDLPYSLRQLSVETVILRLVLAFILSGLIGIERERRGRAAGLRTHILVCLGSAMTTMIGLYVTDALGYSSDPLRVGAQVISGIGFLGAGTILVRGNSYITGLTTAAGLWTTATIGLATGVGFYEGAVICAIIAMIAIVILNRFENILLIKRNVCRLYIEISDISRVNKIMGDMKSDCYFIRDMNVKPARSSLPNNIGMELTLIINHGKQKPPHSKDNIIEDILKIEGVSFVLEIL
ncbi:MAG: MgtC/SapB family protein [Eubacteriales bacterium]|nr:MgtC/SapB family protein [Eubacteriales bacterium]